METACATKSALKLGTAQTASPETRTFQRQLGCLGRDSLRSFARNLRVSWREAMQIKPVGWFEIYVQDMGRAKAFYEAVFSVQFEKLEGPDSSFEMWSFPGLMDEGDGTPRRAGENAEWWADQWQRRDRVFHRLRLRGGSRHGGVEWRQSRQGKICARPTQLFGSDHRHRGQCDWPALHTLTAQLKVRHVAA